MISGIPPALPIDPMRYTPSQAVELRRRDAAPDLKETSGTPAGQAAGDSFSGMLGQMVNEASARQGEAAATVGALQSGQATPLHQAVIAVEEANVSFQLMVEVRNRLLDSYQELMRMQI